MNIIRPYLIFPKLVEQPTWGGAYIVEYKNWQHKGDLGQRKFGQSYELAGASLLAPDIFDSDSEEFTTDDQAANVLPLKELIAQGPQKILGPTVFDRYGGMPLLIKFTQALGNSFQLHKKPTVKSAHWISKAESWYYFEPGRITLGIKKDMDMEAYRTCCKRIEKTMHALSDKVRSGAMPLEQARTEAKEIIQTENPWQYVNVLDVPKDALIDLSGGGLHHSWEENPTSALGNIVYEVQQDVADDDTTIRSFDQGKMKDDGTIRAIHIDDYFRFLDADDSRNDPRKAFKYQKGLTLLSTAYYSLDLLEISSDRTVSIGTSFHHLFVKNGQVEILTAGGSVKLSKGHSCFVPYAVQSYTVRSSNQATILKTYID